LDVGVVRQQQTGLVMQLIESPILSLVIQVAVNRLVDWTARLAAFQQMCHNLGGRWCVLHQQEVKERSAGVLHVSWQVKKIGLRLKQVVLKDSIQVAGAVPAFAVPPCREPRQGAQFHQDRVALLFIAQSLAKMTEDDADGLGQSIRGRTGGERLDAPGDRLES